MNRSRKAINVVHTLTGDGLLTEAVSQISLLKKRIRLLRRALKKTAFYSPTGIEREATAALDKDTKLRKVA